MPIYRANFVALSNSGVTGNASLAFDPSANTLSVALNSRGPRPGYAHAQQSHGPLSGPMGESGTPLPPPFPSVAGYDANDNGYIEWAEAAMAYGEVPLPLTTPPGGDVFSGPFPMASADGTVRYNQRFQLGDPGIYNTSATTGQPFDENQLLPLDERAINIRGMNVPAGIQGRTTAGYSAMLPVAAGLIQAATLPEPGDLAMLVLGVGLIGGLTLTRRRASRLG